MEVACFLPPKPGPEVIIEDAVVNQIPQLFPSDGRPTYTARSLPIGAGVPDLVIVSCWPQVLALAQVEMPSEQVLAYLRAVGRARPSRIAKRIGQPREVIVRCLDGLLEVEAVLQDSDTFSLAPLWREALPDIASIEVKVTDWQRALEQAARNRIFTHRSFVALPEQVALRVRRAPVFRELGIGLLSVSANDDVRVLRRARRHQVRVWTYYYKLAALAAAHFRGRENAIQRNPTTGSGKVS